LENLLLDERTGNCVHVDFDMLFDKGASLKVPEQVPFRLTQNVIDAFGVCGYEGVFRKCCELTLKILRSNEDTLTSVMETFLHDPLLQWKPEKKARSESNNQGWSDSARAKAREYLSVMVRKLQGQTSKDGPPLSVDGAVLDLIERATSDDNLALMFHGWAPFL